MRAAPPTESRLRSGAATHRAPAARQRVTAFACTAAGTAAGMTVDVIGTTRGKGFQGVMKRHNFAGGAATHVLVRLVPFFRVMPRGTVSFVFAGRLLGGITTRLGRRPVEGQLQLDPIPR
mgnify:CR=1 FL=1